MIKLILIILLFSVTACAQKAPETASLSKAKAPAAQASANAPTAQAAGNAPADAQEEIYADEPAETEIISEKDRLVSEIMDSMTIEQKIGQMFFCSFETGQDGQALTEIDEETRETVERYEIGGVIYFASNIDSLEQTKKLSDDFQAISKLPLFIGVDEEGGRVSRITRSGKIDFEKTPPAKQIGNTGDSRKAFEAAKAIANKLTELGINLNFAPCADLNGDNQGVIGDRAFSGDPYEAGEFVAEAVGGYISSGIICSVKHFPGHGIAPGDTHEDMILSEKSLEDILENDALPFEMGVDAGVPMVMASHITVAQWGKPASMSEEAVKYLREAMGFEGLIITDSFRMGAITQHYKPDTAAVNAVSAGINIILMPESLDTAINGVIKAVEGGQIEPSLIDFSVKKILELKYDYGLLKGI